MSRRQGIRVTLFTKYFSSLLFTPLRKLILKKKSRDVLKVLFVKWAWLSCVFATTKPPLSNPYLILRRSSLVAEKTGYHVSNI